MYNNPFEFMQSFMNNSFTKNMPDIDFSSMTNTMKNTAESINSINHKASENLQSIFKKGSDSLQKNTTEMYNTMKKAVSTGDVTQACNCQQQYFQSTIDSNIKNTKEIIDITTKSMMDSLETFRNAVYACTTGEKSKK